MNRKGFVEIGGFVTIFILLLVVVILASAQNGVDLSTINKTIDSLNSTKLLQNVTISLQSAASEAKYDSMKVIINIVDKTVQYALWVILEVAKLAMTLARDNPDIINYKVLLALILLSLIAPLIYPLFIIIVSLILIIKEWWMTRKERNERKNIN